MSQVDKIKSIIHQLIEVPAENKLKHHLTCALKMDQRMHGYVEDGHFILWRFSFLMGLGYPLILGEFSEHNGRLQLRLKTRSNPLAKLIFKSLFLITTLGLLATEVYNQAPAKAILVETLVLLVVFLFFYISYSLISSSSSRNLLQETEALIKAKLASKT